MKLQSVTIHNFRGIIDASMKIHPYTLIVGANNSGKSTVIDCIRAFYEKEGFKFKKENDFPFTGADDEESWAELEFRLSDEEYGSLKEDYQNEEKTLRVRKFFMTEKKLRDGKSAAGVILGYKSDGSVSDEPFYGAKNVQSGKLGDLIYIPAIAKVDDHTKLTGPSALRDLISNIMADVVEGSDSYRAFTKSVSDFAGGVRTLQTEDSRSLSGFEDDLNELLGPWGSNFRLRFEAPSISEMIKSMLQWDILDNHLERPLRAEAFGSGFQRHFIYCLIQLAAKYMPNRSSKKAKDFTPTLNLVLFEEPEAFLHPPQQEDLARSLIHLCESDEWQVVCTTHSSHFVSKNFDRIPSIVRTNRARATSSTFQVDDAGWREIVDSNQAIHAIVEKFPGLRKGMQSEDLTAEMESIKYSLWLNPHRAGMLFAQNVLLVEGPTETALIGRLQDDGAISLPKGTHIMDCLGKFNIHRFMSLLIKLGVPHAVIIDDDDDTEQHRALNQLIEDTSNSDYTRCVLRIPKDLESFLGVPPPGTPQRKPQHLLYCYGSGKFDRANMERFCGLIASCF